MVSSPEDALARAAAIKQLIIIGDAANDNIDLIEKFASTKSIGGRRAWELGPSPEMLAPWIARVALVRYSRGEVTGPGEVRATYVRPAQAEANLALGLVGPGLRP